MKDQADPKKPSWIRILFIVMVGMPAYWHFTSKGPIGPATLAFDVGCLVIGIGGLIYLAAADKKAKKAAEEP
jgi:sugar phosphate permease